MPGQYISFVDKIAADGDVTLTLKSLNISPEVSVAATFSADTTDDCITLATKALDALNDALDTADALYEGVPQFHRPGFLTPTYRVVQCDHILNVWSEGSFRITSSNTAIVSIGQRPSFLTIEELEAMEEIFRLNLTQSDGTPLDEDQKKLLIGTISQSAISLVGGHPVVASTFLETHFAKNDGGFALSKTPVIAYDNPVSRATTSFTALDAIATGVPLQGHFDVDTQTGFVRFADWSPALGYERTVKMTYCAGLATVPDLLKSEVSRLLNFVRMPANLKRIKGASFAMDFADAEEVKTEIGQNLMTLLVNE